CTGNTDWNRHEPTLPGPSAPQPGFARFCQREKDRSGIVADEIGFYLVEFTNRNVENQPPDNFDDASLKSAVRRAWGNERAPESLRKSIALMATPTPTTPPARGWPKFLGSSPIRSVAAAVLLSIGLSYLGYQAYRMTRPTQVRVMVERIPDSMAHKLSEDHDRLLADANKWSPDLPRDNADQLAATLKKKLKYVPMTASPGEGFSLVGTASLGKGNGAELLYQKGNQTVSVFSLPASDVPMCDNNADRKSTRLNS